jgi:DNA-directed RNA polymerase alpha subunit
MKYRGLEYTVVQGIERGVWKWSASVAGVVLVGKAETKPEAVAAAEKAIDRALAQIVQPSTPPVGRMLRPTPELPDDTAICDVDLPTRIRNALTDAGLRTVGEVRETSDNILLSFHDLGNGSVAYLRQTLGLPSCDGVRPAKSAKEG